MHRRARSAEAVDISIPPLSQAWPGDVFNGDAAMSSGDWEVRDAATQLRLLSPHVPSWSHHLSLC
jgi:hypothetical protein